MTQGLSGIPGKMQVVAGVESQLADTLSATTDEIAHSECLSDEDRAEVYAILEAMRADTEAHRQQIKLLSRRLAESGDA